VAQGVELEEVLKDPDALPSDIRAYLEAENAYAEATLAGHRRASQPARG
jgi:protease II